MSNRLSIIDTWDFGSEKLTHHMTIKVYGRDPWFAFEVGERFDVKDVDDEIKEAIILRRELGAASGAVRFFCDVGDYFLDLTLEVERPKGDG